METNKKGQQPGMRSRIVFTWLYAFQEYSVYSVLLGMVISAVNADF